MENINESIARGMESDRPKSSRHLIDARTCMVTNLITLSPSQSLRDVIKILLKHKITGAPVVDNAMRLVGMVSELDCIRVIASGSYDHAPYQMEHVVRGFMTESVIAVGPDEEVFNLVELFKKHSIRRIPIVDSGALIGQVSRRDVLRELSLRY